MSDIVQVLIPPLLEPLTYRLPVDLLGQVEIGCKVEVPLGSRHTHGFVIARQREESPSGENPRAFKLKEIKQQPEPQLCFDRSQLEFFQWVADYYADSLSNVINAAIPEAVPKKFNRTVVLLDNNSQCKLTPSMQKLIGFLREQHGQSDYNLLRTKFKSATRTIKLLVELGVLQVSQEELLDQALGWAVPEKWAKSEIALNERQEQALNAVYPALQAKRFETFLLHGITGSGKTEVYIELFKRALALNCGALIIVPEIALTPQLVDRFRARLPDELAILHSALSKRARWEAWRALVEGRRKIALGTRSALFAPIANLALIVVDEEHDASLKQSEGLRYNARDLAVVRGKLQNCPVVLGSATPSLESLHNVWSKRFHYISLPARPNPANQVKIELVDLSKLKPWHMPAPHVSPLLHTAIKECLEKGEQVFILYNRRGFASYLQCELCEFTLSCPNCSVTLTFHQTSNSLCCHYCNFTMVPPMCCPNCAKAPSEGAQVVSTLVQRGAGTERIIEELTKLFPQAVLDRLDRDAVQSVDDYRDTLDKVRCGKTQILVGTQMIAKGHDLPNVTLVGIADCDVGLHVPDFRAAERVFQLLTQAAGRAGRGERAGQVILQTRMPHHPSLLKTLQQDFMGFAKGEAKARKALNYPPYGKMLRIISSATDKDAAFALIRKVRQIVQPYAQKRNLKISVLGPAAAPLQRVKTRWRFHLIIKGSKASELNQLLHYLRKQKLAANEQRLAFDMDPQDML